MKKKILIPLILIITLTILLIPFPDEIPSEATHEINIEYKIQDAPIDGFGIALDTSNTDNVVILNEDPTFNFAFFYNISLTSLFGPIPVAYGSGLQPDVWWDSREINFSKYGDNEEHFLETRIYGSFNVFIDDLEIGLADFDFVSPTSDNNQTTKMKLGRDEHYLTIVAAEYQLPYVGATIDEVELVVQKIEHVFYVIDNPGDPVPTLKHRPINVSTSGIPYAETFGTMNGIPLEYPKVELIDIDTSDIGNITIDYRYNFSTDGFFSARDGYFGVEFDYVGNGTILWWVNDKPFASSLQSLYGHHNYIYICAISTYPDAHGAFYGGYYGTILYYPILDFYTEIVDIYIETEITHYEEVTVTTTETVYIFFNEYSSLPLFLIVAAIPTMIIFLAIRKKKRGEQDAK